MAAGIASFVMSLFGPTLINLLGNWLMQKVTNPIQRAAYLQFFQTMSSDPSLSVAHQAAAQTQVAQLQAAWALANPPAPPAQGKIS